MEPLRHLGREIFTVVDKNRGIWKLKPGKEVIDLSGGPLLETLFSPVSISDVPFSNIGASGGIETNLRIKVENEVLRRSKLTDKNGILWASSGSDAIEFSIWAIQEKQRACKIICANQNPDFIVRLGGYHGNSYLTRWLSTRREISENELTKSFNRYLLNEDYSMFIESSEIFADKTINQIKDHRVNSGSIIILETVPTTGEVFWPGYSYYNKVIAWCNQNNIDVILDEVASGAYRHGWFSAFEHLDNNAFPAAVCLSKSLTCGNYPLSCVLLREDVTEAIRSSKKRYPAFTYGLNDTSAFITLACFQSYDNLMQNGSFDKRAGLIMKYKEVFDEFLPDFRSEITDTSIRLSTLDEDKASSFSSFLIENNISLYQTTTTFFDKKRFFFIICPAINVENDFFDEKLNELVKILRMVQS